MAIMMGALEGKQLQWEIHSCSAHCWQANVALAGKTFHTSIQQLETYNHLF